MPYPTADQERQARNIEIAESYDPEEPPAADMTEEEIARENFQTQKRKYLMEYNEERLAHLVLQYTLEGDTGELSEFVAMDEETGAGIIKILAKNAHTDSLSLGVLEQLSRQYAAWEMDCKGK